jgi:hypothetical protein
MGPDWASLVCLQRGDVLLKLTLPAPAAYAYCAICAAYHDPRWHDVVWRARCRGDRDALAVYSRPPKRRK